MIKSIIFAVLVLLSFAANGSTCSPLEPAMVVEKSQTIFLGKARTVTPVEKKVDSICWDHSDAGPGCGSKVVEFEVAEVLIGTMSKMAAVLFEDGCYCLGSYIEPGKDYLVVIDSSNPQQPELAARNVCWGTGEIEWELPSELLNYWRSKNH